MKIFRKLISPILFRRLSIDVKYTIQHNGARKTTSLIYPQNRNQTDTAHLCGFQLHHAVFGYTTICGKI